MRAINTTAKGSSLVEMLAGLIVLVPIGLFIFDLGILVIGVQTNDSICREAARAAATGEPLKPDKLAQVVVDRANQKLASTFINNVRLANAQSSITQAQVAALMPFGGPIKGTVTCRTTVDIRPYLLQYAYGGRLPLTFTAKQTFPCTYIVPSQIKP